MIHFAHQEALLFLSPTPLGDIPGYFGCANNFAPAFRIGEMVRDIKSVPFFLSYGFEMIHAVSRANLGQNRRLLLQAIIRDKDGDRLSHNFIRFVSE